MWRLQPVQVTSYLVAALVTALMLAPAVQGIASRDLIPPRHRPFFQTENFPPRAVSFVERHVMTRRDVEEEDKCREFSVGRPDKGEFYSPNYPGHYPNHSECIKLLEAKPGQLLKLDFREKFDLESNFNCTYDFLEIRDGGHGFDRLFSRYCGNTFPPVIISTSRFLWLRFVSDDTIEGSGFMAVYESIPPPPGINHMDPPLCSINVTGYEGWLNSTDMGDDYLNETTHLNKPIDCMWVVNVTEGWKIQLLFKTFELNKPNDCENNFVDIFSPSTEVKHRLKKFCSSMAEMVTSVNNILYVRFYVDQKARNSSFTALFTAFRDGKKDGGCLPDEFDCQDERCIKKDLECNGIENCRFRWDDDDHCLPKTGTLADTLRSEHIIIILVIFCLILSGMCFTFIFNCVRKLVHDHRIIQEHMRQSRASRLDQVGKPRAPPPAQVVAADSGGRSRSSSSLGGLDESPHRTPAAEECYVPGAGDLMPILMGAASSPANGDAVFPRENHRHHHHHHHHHHQQQQQQVQDEEDEDDEEEEDEEEDMELSSFPAPEMRDNECQTRESLFINSNSDRSFTPPPPPPPVTSRGRQQSSSNTSAFSTFGYHRHPHPKSPESKHFRAEAVIEMERGEGDVAPPPASRPFSVESTKSAPDVIVTH